MIAQTEQPEMDEMGALGENLRKLRNERHITQQDLANVSGVSKETISKIESGKQNATSTSLVKLAKGLGCTVDQLVMGIEDGWKGTEDDHIDRLCEELKQLPEEGRSQVIHTVQALIVYWKYRREG